MFSFQELRKLFLILAVVPASLIILLFHHELVLDSDIARYMAREQHHQDLLLRHSSQELNHTVFHHELHDARSAYKRFQFLQHSPKEEEKKKMSQHDSNETNNSGTIPEYNGPPKTNLRSKPSFVDKTTTVEDEMDSSLPVNKNDIPAS